MPAYGLWSGMSTPSLNKSLVSPDLLAISLLDGSLVRVSRNAEQVIWAQYQVRDTSRTLGRATRAHNRRSRRSFRHRVPIQRLRVQSRRLSWRVNERARKRASCGEVRVAGEGWCSVKGLKGCCSLQDV
jgi:hypothetical protein